MADDMAPIPCIGLCSEVIQKNLVDAINNCPDIDDDPDEAAKKYAILGRCLRAIKEHTKEALKSVQMGSDMAAFLIMEGQKHHSLSEYDDAKISITGPDGKTTETTFEQFDRACEAVQKDPSIVDKALGQSGGSE
jgi:hypothetical protein